MKNVFLCMIFAVCFLTSPLVTFSAENKMIETAEGSATELSGQVVSIDIENQQIIVECQLDDPGTVTTIVFSFSKVAEIYKDGEIVSASVIEEGDNVIVVFYSDDNGSKVVSKITIIN